MFKLKYFKSNWLKLQTEILPPPPPWFKKSCSDSVGSVGVLRVLEVWHQIQLQLKLGQRSFDVQFRLLWSDGSEQKVRLSVFNIRLVQAETEGQPFQHPCLNYTGGKHVPHREKSLNSSFSLTSYSLSKSMLNHFCPDKGFKNLEHIWKIQSNSWGCFHFFFLRLWFIRICSIILFFSPLVRLLPARFWLHGSMFSFVNKVLEEKLVDVRLFI